MNVIENSVIIQHSPADDFAHINPLNDLLAWQFSRQMRADLATLRRRLENQS